MIRVLLVDDHSLVRAGLEHLVSHEQDLDVVGSVGSGAEALIAADGLAPDVVLMDLSMPGIDGISATRQIVETQPDSHVVVLTSFSDRDRILQAVDAGAIGYLLKDAAPEELLRGIRAAARGESPLAPKAAQQLIASRHHEDGARTAELTAREHEILALLEHGHPNKIIAQRLRIAEKTVKNHLTHIFQTIGVTDRTQAALWARSHRQSSGERA